MKSDSRFILEIIPNKIIFIYKKTKKTKKKEILNSVFSTPKTKSSQKHFILAQQKKELLLYSIQKLISITQNKQTPTNKQITNMCTRKKKSGLIATTTIYVNFIYSNNNIFTVYSSIICIKHNDHTRTF